MLGLYRSGSGSDLWETIEKMGLRQSALRWTFDSRRARLVQRLAEHPIDPENQDWVEEAIESWHEGDCPELALHEYLGWTRAQYAEWVRGASAPSGLVVESNDAARWSPDLG